MVMFMAIVVTMCKLLITLAIGYGLNKMDILDGMASKKISALIVTLTAPLLVISSVSGVEGNGGEVFRLFLTGVLFYCIAPVIGWIVVRILKIPVNLRGTYMCMVIFSNNTFMGFPVVSALFGDSAIFYTIIFHMGFNLLFFSLGMILIKKDAEQVEGKKTEKKRGLKTLRQVLNNGVIASVLALIIYFTRMPLPQVVTETCAFIGNTTMPLSMLVIGSSIADYSLKEIFSIKRVYVIAAIRLIAMPLLAYLVVRLFITDAMFVNIAAITVGMPVAALVAMGSAPYKEQGKEAAIAVVFTTLCSMVTIPIMCIMLGV